MSYAWHASLTPPMVRRLAHACADSWDCTTQGAAYMLAARWEEMARERKERGLSSWKMYDELAGMALAVWKGEHDAG